MVDSRVARDEGTRQLADPRAMRALAHPLRVSLMELLLREGPLTATQAALLLDDSPGNLSWHFQTLAKYGFVEEAGGGRGRARPWRLVSAGTSFSSTDGDADKAQAATALERLFHQRADDGVQQWIAERHTYPDGWAAAGFATDALTYLTPTELQELGERVSELFLSFSERSLDRRKRPADSRPVHLVAFGHPLTPTPSGN
ncbi:MAG: hypothetical protein QOJ03_2606 [Frankiaceae bacterium]|jgi:DNA-binding transcriptional ArsR family regulator|nr:hypothetical protein [Frankiaceae bacterium]